LYPEELSFIRIEKSPFSWWRRNSKVNTSTGSHRKNQTRGDKKQTKNKKTHTGMDKSASLTPVQGPPTVVRYPEQRYLKCALNAMGKNQGCWGVIITSSSDLILLVIR
jgi:hypothetical protein